MFWTRMRKLPDISMALFQIQAILLLIAVPILGFRGGRKLDSNSQSQVVVRVGFYENPPKIFKTENGTIQGFWPDLINYIAQQEGWKVEWVPGTWEDGLARLAAGEIDIMPDVAWNQERSQIYDFSSEKVLVSWSRLYVRKNSNIETILDLQGKKVAGLQGSINYDGPEGIKDLASRFDIHTTFVDMNTYVDVFNAIQNGSVDAGVVNRDFGDQNEQNYGNIERTPFVFQPVYDTFAFPKDGTLTPYLLTTINAQIKALTANPNSIYYRSLKAHLEEGVTTQTTIIEQIPGWVKDILYFGGGLILFLLALSYLSRREVQRKTAALRESEEKYRKLIEQLPAIVYVNLLDGKGTNMFISPQVESILGVPVKEWLERDVSVWTELIHPEDRQQAMETYSQLTENGQPYELEYRVNSRSGRLVWIHDKGEVLRDNAGELLLHGVMFDITERKQGEAERQRLLNILEVSLNELYLFDPDTLRFEYANQGAMRNLGYSLDQLKAMTPLDLKPEFTKATFRRLIEPLLQHEQEGLVFQTVHRRSDGSLYPVEVHLQLVEKSSQRVFLAVILDITERKKSEQALMAAEQDYRSIFENASVGIFQSTPEGQFLKVNSTMARMYGYDSTDNMVRTVNNISQQIYVDSSVREQFQNRLRKNGEVINFEYQNLRKDGSIIWISENVRAVKNDAGQIVYYEGFIRDVTDQKQAEEALHQIINRQKKLIEASPDGIVENDLSGNIISLNSRFAEMFGFESAEEILDTGIGTFDLLAPEEKNTAPAKAEPLFEFGVVRNVEMKVTRKDGTTFDVEFSTTITEEDNEDSRTMITFVRDITERKQAEEKIRQQISYLIALQEIDSAITSAFDMRLSLNILLSRAVSILNVDAATVLLVDTSLSRLKFAAGIGFRTTAIETANIRLGVGFVGRAIMERRLIRISDLAKETDDARLTTLLKDEMFVSCYAVPLIVKGKAIGVLGVFHRSALEHNPEWLDILNTLSGRAAVAIDNVQMYSNLQRSHMELMMAYDATIAGWSHAMDLRDEETEGHTQRVTELTERLAERMGIDPAELVNIRRGALLHDIGKLGVPDSILLKPDKLTRDEWKIMKIHPIYAREMLLPIDYLKSTVDIPYCHHEKWDGTGYPQGLKGEQIPMAARIFSVVDVWDALISNRPYRKAWSEDKALDYIREQSGKHFDPKVVNMFLGLMAEDRK